MVKYPPFEWARPTFDASRVRASGATPAEAREYLGEELWGAGGEAAYTAALAAAPEPVKEGDPKKARAARAPSPRGCSVR